MRSKLFSTDPENSQRNRNRSLIGGVFGLERADQPRKVAPPFLAKRDIFLLNGRCGIWLLVNRLRPGQVWVPSYLCRDGILEAIDPALTVRRFYEIDYDLNVTSDEWVSEVRRGDLVIFIDYFGFSCDRRLAAKVKQRGAWVLEDASQALLSGHVGRLSDFVLFNIVKWIGVPEGAVLRCPEEMTLEDTQLEAPAPGWWLKALQSSVLRREFDDGVPTRDWFALFREIEDTMPTGPYAMSQLARTLMLHSVDYPSIARKRRENYSSLLDRLRAFALFPDIGPDVVPLGFPVRTGNRDTVRRALFDNQIYPPVHWHLDGVVPSRYQESLRLSRDIMTLPCDQRYGLKDMTRMADLFLHISSQ